MYADAAILNYNKLASIVFLSDQFKMGFIVSVCDLFDRRQIYGFGQKKHLVDRLAAFLRQITATSRVYMLVILSDERVYIYFTLLTDALPLYCI